MSNDVCDRFQLVKHYNNEFCVRCGHVSAEHKHVAHVIQCNDMVVSVVLGTESEAAERMATEKAKKIADDPAWRAAPGVYWHIVTAPLY